MSYFSDLDLVRQEMSAGEEPDPVGQALRVAETATYDLVVFANSFETRQQILDNPKVINRILANIQLVATLLETNKPRAFRMIRNA